MGLWETPRDGARVGAVLRGCASAVSTSLVKKKNVISLSNCASIIWNYACEWPQTEIVNINININHYIYIYTSSQSNLFSSTDSVQSINRIESSQPIQPIQSISAIFWWRSGSSPISPTLQPRQYPSIIITRVCHHLRVVNWVSSFQCIFCLYI